MIILNVYFAEYDINYSDGTAVLYENLISNEVKLILNNHLLIGEIEEITNKAKKILQKRYDNVEVHINWETAKKEEK